MTFPEKTFSIAWVCFWCSYPNIAHTQDIKLNEMMSSNAFSLADEDGDHEDWIELYNAGSDTINLEGYRITDNPSDLSKWTFPSAPIPPGDFLIVFASGKDRTEGELHTNFSISIEGETILLSDADGQAIDFIPPVEMLTNHSYGRLPDGSDSWTTFVSGTPGFSNNEGILYTPPWDTLMFSANSGLFNEPFNLTINQSDPETQIFYTLDGSDPDTTAIPYESPIAVQDRTDEANNLSSIQTTASNASHPYHWIAPDGQVFKGTVVKAQSFLNGTAASPLYTNTYLVDENIESRFNGLPIVSIVTDSLNLFDYDYGIYTPGRAADEETYGTFWWGHGNFFGKGSDWERPAHLTLFESDGSIALNQQIGIRIHGHSSRSLPLKSLRLYARNQYGKGTLDYAFFPWRDVGQYERIMLRQSGNDFPFNYFADGLSSLLAEGLELEKQDYRPAVVFINGEFWGIMNFRDRLDHRFLNYTANADASGDHLTIMSDWTQASMGSPSAFQNLLEYLESHDLSNQEHYTHVISHFDLSSLLDYFITKIFIGVYDWPGNNNRFWRHEIDSPFWRWIYFDNDACLIYPEFNSMEHATAEDGPAWPNPPGSTLFLRSLLQNDGFKELFLDRFEYLMLNRFTEENINHLTDSIVSILAPVMPEHIARWRYPASVEVWNSEVELIRQFAKDRPCYMLSHLLDFFDITDPQYGFGICDSIVTPLPPALASADSFVLWPNPATDFLNIRTKEAEAIITVDCYDLSGRLVHRFTLPHSRAGENITFSVSNLPSAPYLLRIQTEKQVWHARFIKLQ
ncbi:MAG: T9SS C-terminal target domain-containing protein [Cryomorphaceae bacterium]|nr:MAG: T9SS C-terminal target domain-containing protein [Cryomorphaceae bacterium]